VTAVQRHAIADALGRLLAELGLDRYAATCASTTTHELLDAYATDPDAGFDAFRSAVHASGVEPADTASFAWGEVMELTGAAADTTVARRVEDAIATGRLSPAAGGAGGHARG
jgi:hypothetical protein